MRTAPLHRRLLFLVPAVLWTASCATGAPRPSVGPEDIPRLQRELSADPANLELKTQLGIAYFTADAFEQARGTLSEAIADGAQTGAAFLYLGLANEELEEWAAARDAYSNYLEVGESDPLKEQLRGRMQLMIHRALRQQAEVLLAQEEQLADVDPTPRSVAVFPFDLEPDVEELAPLGVAMADMMITDLELAGDELTVLERGQIQALLSEMELTEAGFTDPAQGARAGRLLRAEHVVQGFLTPLPQEVLRMDTDVLNTPRAESIGEAQAEDQLQQIFDIEKEVVLQIIEILEVELSPEELEEINQNRAANLEAFLAYGRGLIALDEGNFNQASEFFGQASQLDPGFSAAGEKQSEAEQMGDAEGTSTGDVAEAAGTGAPSTTGGGQTQTATNAPGAGGDDLLNSINDGVNSTPATSTLGTTEAQGGTDTQTNERDPAQEAGQSEGGTSTATLRVIIPRPPPPGTSTSSGSGGGGS